MGAGLSGRWSAGPEGSDQLMTADRRVRIRPTARLDFPLLAYVWNVAANSVASPKNNSSSCEPEARRTMRIIHHSQASRFTLNN